ncbi:MAG: PQQ-binding-like beta-propeller repeat protein [Planctomycetota bacterium]
MSPVCDETRVYLNLGTHLRVFERKTGKLVDVVPNQDDPDIPTADLAMSDIGWLLVHSPGARAVTVHKGLVHFARLPRAALPSRIEAKLRNELVAYDVEKRAIVWRIGGGTDTDTVLKRGVFFRGAPAVAGSRLFVFGAARVKSEDGEFTRKEEGYLFCFDRRTGELLWRRLLAYGDTESPPTFPPQAGVAPAYSRGVVTVVTGLGVAAAVDERDGEILWLLRHSRMRFRERQRLSRNRPDRSLRHRSAWFREAPRIVGDSVYFAPFDGEELLACWLRGKLIDGDFFVVRWEKSRKKDHFNCLLEQVGGIHGGRIFSIGRPDDRNPRLYESVVSVPLDLGRGLAYGRLPAIVRDRRSGLALPPELFGRACIAGDVLLVPTETRLYRFDLSAIHTKAAGAAAETVHEIASLKPYEGLAESRSSFGNLIAVDGILYAATVTELIAYGPASAKPDPPEEGPPEGPPPQDGPEEDATGNDPE